MEAASSARSPPPFDYPLVHDGEPSHRPEGIPSPHRTKRGRESGHTTTERQELKKALHELVDKGQICRFLKKGPRFLRREQEPAPPLPRDEERSTEVVEVNPTGMIRLPVCFGDKIMSKSLEVDFLVVDMPMDYNVIYGSRSSTRTGGGSHVELCPILMLLLRSPGLCFQEVGGLVLGNLTLGRRRDKLHLLRVAALSGRPLTLIHVVEVRLEVTIVLKLIGQAPLIPHDEPLQPLAFRNSPHPSSEDLGHGYLFLGHLGGIRSPKSFQVPGLNYVISKRELGGRVRLNESNWGGAIGSLRCNPCNFGRAKVLLPRRRMVSL
ncbi:hypothetical protein Cgig2_026215 [Carnegiea gigantea]|uniref:Uncharacterized protein n=1 Tax=Carnegiea gigantea TaxID=171969 RepID=A0A9Q1QI48_9CARY|nr:hypothetical protein Cgig2_026215 [Carnegiea gigantea]